ncbi:MAG: hypothetical protein KF734_05375 [Saprospiraceae bacterium]|nr:hypothetical protein [Saprospiraceae bacterium]
MKKLIFINCVLAVAVLFTFCSKPDRQEELIPVDTVTSVEERTVSACLLSITGATTWDLVICGTNTNQQACNPCGVVQQFLGVEVATGGNINLSLNTPIVISISAPDGPQQFDLTAGANVLQSIRLLQGQCRSFHIDANCVIAAL